MIVSKSGGLLAVLLLPAWLMAQEPAPTQPATLTGRVTNEVGMPLAGVGITIEQLSAGTQTRDDGNYTLTVPAARIPQGPVAVTARLIGYRSHTVQVALQPGTQTQDFLLPDNPLQLGELVVTGAGTMAEVEKLGTGRSFIDSTAILRSAEPNLITALAAKAPNVTVVSASGDAGASAHLMIRGQTTITAGGGTFLGADAQPLIILDGVPINNTHNYNNPAFAAVNGAAAPSNRGIDISPMDIENIEVLKGAASGAIYGSRAGQGVVLITTKQGKPGPTRYSFHSSASFDEVGRVPEFQRKYGMGTGGLPPAACAPGGTPNCRVIVGAGSWGPEIPAGSPVYDHSTEVFRTGHTFQNGLSVSGGNDRTTFYLSAAATNQRGIVVGDNDMFDRLSVRFNGSHRVLDNLKVGANIAYMDVEGGYLPSRNATDGLLLGSWRSPPDFNNWPYRDPATGLHRSFRFPNPAPGSEQSSRVYDNPFFVAHESFNRSEVGRTFGVLNAEYAALPWLTFNYTLGADYANDERTQGYPWSTSAASVSGVAGVGGVQAGYIRSFQVDHNLAATARYRLSDVWAGSVTVGQNLNSNTYQTRQLIGTGLIAPEPYNLGNTSSLLPPWDYKETIRLESYFAQATADLYDQLYLTAALRYDGASTFGADRRRNLFPKGSIAWTPLRGRTVGDGTLSYAKLRAAYGQSGTQPQPYLLSSVLVGAWSGNDGGYGPAIGTQPGGAGGLISKYVMPTTDLGPERVKEFEAGFDVGLFRDKADLGFTWYRSVSTDVILNLPVAASTGYTERPANAAKLRNAGIEVALNIRPITTRDLSWELGFQVGTNRNRVLDLAGVQFVPLPIGGGTNGLTIRGVAIEGHPVGVYYGQDYVRCGRGLTVGGVDIDNTDGHCQGAPAGALYVSDNGYPLRDNEGTYVIGDPNPDWTGAIRTAFRWKKLSVGGLLDIRQGGLLYNGTRAGMNHFGTSRESQVYRDGGTYVFGDSYFGHETVAGPGAGDAVPLGESWFAGAGGLFGGPQSAFLEDASFVKLREISVGYLFDGPWVSRVLGFTSLELRVAGRNLHTWTDYSGIDPETSLLGAASPVRGIDVFNNPQSRSFVFSVTLNH